MALQFDEDDESISLSHHDAYDDMSNISVSRHSDHLDASLSRSRRDSNVFSIDALNAKLSRGRRGSNDSDIINASLSRSRKGSKASDNLNESLSGSRRGSFRRSPSYLALSGHDIPEYNDETEGDINSREPEYSNEAKTTSLLEVILDEIFFSSNMPLVTKFIMEYDLYDNEGFHHGRSTSDYIWMVIKHLPFILLVLGDIVLRGVSQVFLCNNPLTGLLICIGLWLTSGRLLLLALLGTFFATLGAYLVCGSQDSEVFAGLCGYDGTLVGGAMYTFISASSDELTGAVVGLTLLLSFGAGVVHHACMNMNKLPALTLAFNILTILYFFSLARGYSSTEQLPWLHVDTNTNTDAETDVSDSRTDMTAVFLLDALFRGVGQFCFVDTTLGGFFVVLGIALASRPSARIALLGSIVGALTARYIFEVPPSARAAIQQGIYGYNSMGCAVAIGGDVFFASTWGAMLVAVCAAVLSVLFQLGMQSILDTDSLRLPVLTMPFVAATWLIMLTRSPWLVPILSGDVDLDDALHMMRRRHDDGSWLFRDLPNSKANNAIVNLTAPSRAYASRQQSGSSRKMLTWAKQSSERWKSGRFDFDFDEAEKDYEAGAADPTNSPSSFTSDCVFDEMFPKRGLAKKEINPISFS